MTGALSQLNAWPVVRQCRASREFLILSSDGAFMFFHTCRELATGFAHVCIGAARAWDVVHHIPLFRWVEGLSHSLAFPEVTW